MKKRVMVTFFSCAVLLLVAWTRYTTRDSIAGINEVITRLEAVEHEIKNIAVLMTSPEEEKVREKFIQQSVRVRLLRERFLHLKNTIERSFIFTRILFSEKMREVIAETLEYADEELETLKRFRRIMGKNMLIRDEGGSYGRSRLWRARMHHPA